MPKFRFAALLVVVTSLLVPTFCKGQQAFFNDRATGLGFFRPFTGLVPLPYGQIRACSIPLTQVQPCLPLAPLWDVNGTPISNSIGGAFGQIQADVTGRFSFQCNIGVLQIQVAATGSNTPQANYPVSCGFSNSSPWAVSQGGTGLTAVINNGVLYGVGTSQFGFAGPGGGGTLALCETNGGIPFFSNCTITGTGTPLISNTPFPATAGAIRLASVDTLNFRNTANSGNINGISKGADDTVVLGGPLGISTPMITSPLVIPTVLQSPNTPALSGYLRLGQPDSITMRNAAGTGDLTIVSTSGFDQITLGNINAINGAGSNLAISAAPAAGAGVQLFAGSSGVDQGAQIVAQGVNGSFASGVIQLVPHLNTGTGTYSDIFIYGGLSQEGDPFGGAGYKHRRFAGTCATAAAAGATCTTLYSFTTSFGDNLFTPVCWGVTSTGTPILSLSAQTSGSITVKVTAATAVASSFAGVDCQVVHD